MTNNLESFNTVAYKYIQVKKKNNNTFKIFMWDKTTETGYRHKLTGMMTEPSSSVPPVSVVTDSSSQECERRGWKGTPEGVIQVASTF